jgi:hypothetical protein
MGIDDTVSDVRAELRRGIAWYEEWARREDGPVAAGAREFRDLRICYTLLTAAGFMLDKFTAGNGADELAPLIDAYVAGDVEPIDAYVAAMRATPGIDPSWPERARAFVVAVATMRRVFDPLMPELEVLTASSMADARAEARAEHDRLDFATAAAGMKRRPRGE